ncbi:ABC transporter G family member 36 [Hondaea fermentalgiana]|uniref:ABC transporter G family member 36 n=1 Tax=Hondaea fermentalgiana TaxID=2315210 RepID=A0A2R5GPD8_9STRA|nr:ABC transporter G family member 36 [Hondaea fermentalgiana]|eukprot:GBG31648.1 ABC transporter G family member 36 [Hondaea fermentalgiana]
MAARLAPEDDGGSSGAALAEGGGGGGSNSTLELEEEDVELLVDEIVEASSEGNGANEGNTEDLERAAENDSVNRATPEEVVRIREMLGRLQKQVAKRNRDPAQAARERVPVMLTNEEVELLSHLLGRGLIRAPSTLRGSTELLQRRLSAVQYSALVSRTRGDGHWPVHVGFRDLEYTVSVPKADVGIATVASALMKLVSPILSLLQCKSRDRIQVPVLRKISGAFDAGVSTLVLGPPGCGVSTLFKVLSGRAKVGGRYKRSGDVFYSGFRPEELHVRKLAMYVDQLDQHTAVLSVRETLHFAYECFGGAEKAARVNASAGAEEHATEEEKAKIQEQLERFPEFVIHNLALDRAADTIVGGMMLRGISGGERKRVTSGEMFMARRPLTFYDQISTGLDSAATFDICRRITGVAKNLNLTPIVALLQPPPEVYNLFDEILVLALGHIVYHGPRADVLPYFSSIGFECPFDRDIADFIQEVTTPARVRFQTRADAPRDEVQMARAWEASPYSQAKRDAVKKRCDPENKVDGATRRELYARGTPVYANSMGREFALVLRRQARLVFRDPAFVKARLFQSIIMGIVIGTVFIRIDPNLPTSSAAANFTPITQRYGVMFSTLMQCTLSGMAQVPVVLNQRPVYYKQSNAFFFRTVNYIASEVVSVLPMAIIETVILCSLVFWITGIVPWGDASQTGESDVGSRYLIILVVMISLNVSFSAYVRAFTSMVPSPAIGQVVAAISISASVVYSGFIVVQSSMEPWFIWIYYLSPIAWAYRAAILTVFTSSAFTPEQSAFALELFDFPQNKDYIWAGVLMLMAYLGVNVMLAYFGYTMVRYESFGGRQTKVSPDAEDVQDPELVEVERVLAERNQHAEESLLGNENLVQDSDAASSTEKDKGEGAAASNEDGPEANDDTKTNAQSGGARDSAVAPPPSRPLVSGPGESRLRIETSLQSQHFIPADLVFRNLWYAVQGPDDKKGKFGLDLLKGISGFAEAGTLTALMGSSGAGKTTLLDVLAQRKTSGSTRGEILVNGRPQEKISFSRIVGYVEQDDIHSPSATVEEAFRFSAFLRQPADVSREEKERFVNGVIDTLNLERIRDFKIGSKFSGGLTTEQVKRVTIGVELAANPAIIFADEPTSGLDALSARVVMLGLERIARAGRTVICTIHQPSKDIFLRFDRLLLLRRGGETVYFGDLGVKAQLLLDYLEAIPGTAPMADARYNPATYMLEAIGAGAGEESLVDYAHEYRESELRVANEDKLDELISRNIDERPEINFDQRFASGFGVQLEMLMLRWIRGYWRNPGYNATRFIMAVFIAMFFGFTFFQQAANPSRTQEVQSFCGLLYIGTSFMGVISVNTAIPTIFEERAAYYRERAASYYGVAPMIVAVTSAEVPYVFAAAVVHIPIFYFLVHFYHEARTFFLYLGVYIVYQLAMTFWGHLLASLSPNQAVSGIIGAISIGLWVLTAGLTIAVRDIPIFWYWLSCINPIRYAFNALVVIQLACDDPAERPGAPGCNELSNGSTAWGFVQDNFGFQADDWMYCIGALAGFVVGFRVLTILAYTYVSYLKR